MSNNGKPKRPTGRPAKIGPDQEKEVIACLTVGASLRDAAAYIGVDYKTLYRYRKADKSFANRLESAVARGKLHHLNKIGKAPQWQASAFMLERKWPDEFARKDRNQLDITSGGKTLFRPITLDGDKTPAADAPPMLPPASMDDPGEDGEP